jgi:exopolysaccharide biosynthesis WecB/TagA/CpsF family protein
MAQHAVESKLVDFYKDFNRVVRFGDFTINCLSRKELVNAALADCAQSASSGSRLVFDANGHALSLAKTNPKYRSDIQHADIIHADGGFLVTLSRFLDVPSIPERSATTDMLHDFAAAFSETSHGFYLLGGEERVNRECCDILQAKYSGLRISGRRNGFFDHVEEQLIVDAINESGAEVLWVGLGKPKEQDFCVRWKNKLKPKWIITCGGCFNYVTGDYGRAPKWMQRFNVEWLYRMTTNPRKLFRRYAITNPHALWIALVEH